MAKVTVTWAWVATAINYDIQYKKSVDAIWTTAAGSPMVNPGAGPEVDIQIDGLDAETLYDFRVRSNCGVGIQSDWDVQTKSTTVMMTVTARVGVGIDGGESITVMQFIVATLDSGYVLPAPIVTPDEETFPLQASAGYSAVVRLVDSIGGVMDGSLSVYVNGIIQDCVNTSVVPFDYILHFDSEPGDIVMIEWTTEECSTP